MPHFKAKMHQIRFPASVRPSRRPSLRWSLKLCVHMYILRVYRHVTLTSSVQYLRTSRLGPGTPNTNEQSRLNFSQLHNSI